MNKKSELVALISRTDMRKNQIFQMQPRMTRNNFLLQLRWNETKDKTRAAALVKAGVDVIVIDSSQVTPRINDMVRHLKSSYPDLQVIGGNIVTGAQAREISFKLVWTDYVWVWSW